MEQCNTKGWAKVARMNAIMVEVEGMKVANRERTAQGYALAYSEDMFVEAANELRQLADELEAL